MLFKVFEIIYKQHASRIWTWMPSFVRRPNPNRIHRFLEKKTISLSFSNVQPLTYSLSLSLHFDSRFHEQTRICVPRSSLLLSQSLAFFFLLLDIYLIALCHQHFLHLKEKYRRDVSKCLSFRWLMWSSRLTDRTLSRFPASFEFRPSWRIKQKHRCTSRSLVINVSESSCCSRRWHSGRWTSVTDKFY